MNAHLSRPFRPVRVWSSGVIPVAALLLIAFERPTTHPAPLAAPPLQTASAGATDQANTPQLVVTLTPEKSAIILGEPTSLAFTVRNLSDQDLQIVVGGDYQNALGRPDSFKVHVEGVAGQPVPQPDAGGDRGGLSYPQKLPAHGEYVFKLFLPHWATFQFSGTYKIKASRILAVSLAGSDAWMKAQGGTQIASQATTTLRVLPYDAAKMGQIIAAYGTAMTREPAPDEGTDAQEAAARYLAAIHDTRVIAYFVKVFDRLDYEWKAIALEALTPYSDDAALETLKRGMAIKGTNFPDDTGRELSDQLAANIRQLAADGLAHSPHPQAYPFLLTQLHDPDYGVRLTVLHTAANHRPHPDLVTVQSLAQDPDTTVRDEAKRYLKELAAH